MSIKNGDDDDNNDNDIEWKTSRILMVILIWNVFMNDAPASEWH